MKKPKLKLSGSMFEYSEKLSEYKAKQKAAKKKAKALLK